MPLAPSGEAALLTTLLTSRYISLHTGDPLAGNEVATGSYARVAGGAFSQTGSNPTEASNDALIEFPVATADWGSITHAAVYTASSGGSLLAYAELDIPRTILDGDVFRFSATKFKVLAD